MLFFIAGLNYADRAAITAVFPLLRNDLGLTDMQMAATGSLFLWAYALGSPFAGRLADRISRSRMVVVSLLCWSLITLAAGFSASTGQLLATRVCLGIAECAYLPAAVALIADHHSAQSRATAMGVHLAGLNFGLVAGGALAGYLGERYGWRWSFLLLGGAGLVLAGVAKLVLVDGTGDHSRRTVASFSSAARALGFVRSYWVTLAQAMIIAIGVWMFINWLPLYFRETFQMSLAGAGFSGTFMLQGAATLGILVGGYLSDRIAGTHRERRMLFQSVCYFFAAPFLLAFLAQPGYGLISACIFGFSFLRAVGASNEHAIVCDLLPTELRSTAVGAMNTFNCMAGGAGILLAGELKGSLGLGSVFASIAGLTVFAGGLTLLGYLFLIRQDLDRRNKLVAQQELA